MKKLHTIIAMVAFVIFGLLFAAFDNSSPPISAENVQFTQDVNSETAQTVQTDFVGDIPIVSDFSQTESFKNDLGLISQKAKFSESTNCKAAQNRRTEIKTLLSVISEVRNKPPERFDTNYFTNNLTAFTGFDVEGYARAKI